MTIHNGLTKEQKLKKISRITGWKKMEGFNMCGRTWDEIYLNYMDQTHCKRCNVEFPDESITHHTHKRNLTADRGILCMLCNIQTKQPNPKTYKKKSY